MIDLLRLGISPIGGLLNRMRGGYLGDKIREYIWSGYHDFTARCVMAVPTGINAATTICCIKGDGIQSVDRWVVLAGVFTGASCFVGELFGHKRFQGVDKPGQMLGWSLLGLAQLAGMSVPFWFYSWQFACLFLVWGLLKGPVYKLGNLTPLKIPSFTQGPEVAEAYWGWWIWLLFAMWSLFPAGGVL